MKNIFVNIATVEISKAHKVIENIKGWKGFQDADLFENKSNQIVNVNYNAYLDTISIEDENGHELLSFN